MATTTPISPINGDWRPRFRDMPLAAKMNPDSNASTNGASCLLAQLEMDYMQVQQTDAMLHEHLVTWRASMEQWMHCQRDMFKQIETQRNYLGLSPFEESDLLVPSDGEPSMGNSSSFDDSSDHAQGKQASPPRLPASVRMTDPVEQLGPDARGHQIDTVSAVKMTATPVEPLGPGVRGHDFDVRRQLSGDIEAAPPAGVQLPVSSIAPPSVAGPPPKAAPPAGLPKPAAVAGPPPKSGPAGIRSPASTLSDESTQPAVSAAPVPEPKVSYAQRAAAGASAWGPKARAGLSATVPAIGPAQAAAPARAPAAAQLPIGTSPQTAVAAAPVASAAPPAPAPAAAVPPAPAAPAVVPAEGPVAMPASAQTLAADAPGVGSSPVPPGLPPPPGLASESPAAASAPAPPAPAAAPQQPVTELQVAPTEPAVEMETAMPAAMPAVMAATTPMPESAAPAPPAAPPMPATMAPPASPPPQPAPPTAPPAAPPMAPPVAAAPTEAPEAQPTRRERLSERNVENWVRKRVHALGVVMKDLGMGAGELANLLKDLDDSVFVPPFTEVKMWLGLEEGQELTPALAQLVMEFGQVRPLRKGAQTATSKAEKVSKRP